MTRDPARRRSAGRRSAGPPGRGARLAAAAGCLALSVLAVAGLTVTGLAVAGAGPATAAAQPLADCGPASGVILGVDFGHWGGPLLRSCGSVPTTGYALLNQGGWHTTGTLHDGPAFICRIGYRGYQHDVQYPTAAQQACAATPPVGAYWAFWQAGPHQTTWTYSQYGAADYHPEPGSVTVWVFGGTDLSGSAGSAKPPFSPQALRTAATAGGLKIVNAPPVTASVSVSHGSPWPTLTAGAIVVALVAAGAVAVAGRRRRVTRS